MLQTKTNAADGSITFDALTYDAAGEYTYTVKEVAGSAVGYTYDANVYTVTVTVALDEEANAYVATTESEEIVFVNTYTEPEIPDPTSASFAITASKTLTGADLTAGQFTFQLSDGDGVLQTKTNAADGSITFDALTYDAAGEYTYTVKEVAGSAVGYTYDANVYTVTVTVALDEEANAYVATTESEEIVFVNTYTEPEPDPIDITVTKEWNHGSNPGQYRPASVAVQLYADGVASGDAVTLNARNEWTYTWEDLNPSAEYTVDEVEVPEGYSKQVEGSAEDGFVITNTFVDRVYNVWFNGGDHGTVKVNGDNVEGVYRNRVGEPNDRDEITWSPNNLPNFTNKNLYQVGADKIYPTIGMGPEITSKYAYVMYTFTWADYLNYKASQAQVRYLAADEDMDALYDYNLAITPPKLDVDSGYKSDKVFYLNSTEIPFDDIDAAVEYMNKYVTPDNRYGTEAYNVLYVPLYDTDDGGNPHGGNPPGGNPPGGNPPSGGGSFIINEPPIPLAPMPEPEVPLTPAPELEEILDEEIPLADVPKTGDASALWLALSALSGMGLAGVSTLGRKKRED